MGDGVAVRLSSLPSSLSCTPSPRTHLRPPRAQIWNQHGTLLGKITLFPSSPADLPSSLPRPAATKHKTRYCANFCLCPEGRLCILAEDRVYVAQLDAEKVRGSLLPERA